MAMLVLISTLFYYLLPFSSANEDDKQLNDSENNNKPLPLPDYGPKAFEEAKKQFPGFITTRGTMPEIDEIYQVIDKHFEQEGISEVPVVFVYINITDDLAPVDEPDENKNNDTNLTIIKRKLLSMRQTIKCLALLPFWSFWDFYHC